MSGKSCFSSAAGWLVMLATVQMSFGQAAAPPPPTMALPLAPSSQMSVAGSASIQQNVALAGTNTIDTSVSVNGNLQGSVPDANVPKGTITLGLVDAVQRGLRTNLGLITANDSSSAARAQRIQTLAALLPNISANASVAENQVNLAAYGFSFKVPASLGFAIPSIVGPFSYVQMQGTVSQSILDPVAIQNWRATKDLDNASRLSAKDARELVVLAVAGSYMQTVATAARIESQRAQVANAQAVYDQAEVRKTAGTNSKIDVMRTLVELQTQKQRLNSLDSDWRKEKIALARAIGLPFDQEIVLSEPLAAASSEMPEAGAAIAKALQDRLDLQAATAQVHAAEKVVSAAKNERLPSITANGNYGVSGPDPSSTHGVFAVSGSLNIPIWAGGRTSGDILQAETTLKQRQSELADERRRVEQEVRDSLIELQTASGQVELSQSNRSYAAETLQEARDRFGLGVANTVEVVQAQEQVAAAETDYISSLLSYDLSRLSLARAMGQAEVSLPDLLKGNRP